MAEGARLTVMGGPLAGTCLEIEDAVDEILVGSDPDCRLSLDLPGVSPIHARVWRDLGGITVYDTRSPRGLYVNDDRVVDQAALRDGDVLWLGPPGDPDSVMIQCRLPEDSFLGAPVTEPGFGAEPGVEPETTASSNPEPVEPEPESLLSFADAPADDAPVDPAPVDDDAAFLLDAPAEPPAAPVPAEAPIPAPPVEIALDAEIPPFAMEPPRAAPAPAPAASAIPADADFLTDPAWGAYDALDMPAVAAVPLDLDALLGDEASAPPAPVDAPPPAVQRTEGVIALGAPAAAASATIVRQAGGTPPLTRAPRAIIDDTRPESPRKADAGRAGVPDGVMDWARGAPGADADVPAAPVRPTVRAARVAERRTGRSPLIPIAGGVALLAALAGGYFAWMSSHTPRIDGVSPTRVTVGGTLTVTGAHLGESAIGTSATIGGRPARVVQASGDRVQVEVPELPATPGRDASVPVVITAGGQASAAAMVAVYAAPRLKSLAPDIGMPGDSVVLTGAALGAGVRVRFGDAEAEVLAVTPGTLTVRVPALPSAAGAELPVVAAMGADRSNVLLFVIGKVPLVFGVEPRSASPGDLVTISGRGFDPQAAANRVTVGGVPALVVSSGAKAIEVVVPRVIA